MKRIIPAIIAIVLIILVIGGSFGLKMLEKYSYSDEKQNLEELRSIGFFPQERSNHQRNEQ